MNLKHIKQTIKSYGKQDERLLKWGGHSASLDKTKYFRTGFGQVAFGLYWN